MLHFNEIEAVVKKESQLKRINLNNWGEPLLHPNITEIIEMIKAHIPDCYVSFATNGYWLGSVAKRLLASNLDEIQLSLDGPESIYNQIRRGASYSEVMESIDRFLLYERICKSKMKIIAKMVITADNEKYAYEFNSFWDSKGVEVRFQPLLTFNDERTKPCPEMFNELVVVLSDGVIVPCCGDYNGHLQIGHIRTNSLTEAWNSPKAEFMRKLHKAGRYPKTCMKCSEYRTSLAKERFAID
jgi:radical SAM protein with 4Fe4S-binding SPASM domain